LRSCGEVIVTLAPGNIERPSKGGVGFIEIGEQLAAFQLDPGQQGQSACLGSHVPSLREQLARFIRLSGLSLQLRLIHRQARLQFIGLLYAGRWILNQRPGVAGSILHQQNLGSQEMQLRSPDRIVEASAYPEALGRLFEGRWKLALTPRLLGGVVKSFRRRPGKLVAGAEQKDRDNQRRR
jgi:hypothetical protein